MKYRIGIDVGGTFTDFLMTDQLGNSTVYKTLSTPKDPTIGFFNGLTEMAQDHNMELQQFIQQIELIVHGTTVGTNAALTYSGVKTALLTTKGFRDVLEMRQGLRPDAYNNQYISPKPFVPRHLRIGIRERIDYTGREVTPLSEQDIHDSIDYIREQGVEAVAISFMHSYSNAEHEKKAGEILRERLPDHYVTISSELVPRSRLYDRSSTTVLNSYIGPIIKNYLTNLTRKLEDLHFSGTLLIMQSNGGVATPQATIAKAANTLLSGPASAPVAGSWYLKPHGIGDALTMDMGGTSFDVALVKDGYPLIRTEGEIADWPISLPTVDIHTIGSGGGSIAWVDEGGLLHVGPKSAGAHPGPACYGFGAELPTVTDANLVLGYLNPGYFLGGKMKLDLEAARRAIKTQVADKLGISVEEAAQGIIDMVNVNMANGIREITTKRGYDPREFPLVCAGGAGPLHAAAIAEELESTLVFIPKESSIFCAAGMLMSDLRHDFVKVLRTSTKTTTLAEVLNTFHQLEEQGTQELRGDGVNEEDMQFHYSLDMMYKGQYFQVNVPFTAEETSTLTIATIEDKFHKWHDQLFGYSTPEMEIEIMNFNLSALGITQKPNIKHAEFHGKSSEHAFKGSRPMSHGESGKLVETPVYDGDALVHGNVVIGPAIIEQKVTTIIVSDFFNVIVDKNDNYIMHSKEVSKESIQHFIEEKRGVIYE
ncbi:hydantoinase/oxoprolinase family protein [Bacillus sp. 1NLA3E]|uniref:hydantoinase/oxoprolinase family protein n=1 Tax=Bacillus sp. 1NLA3E TaxID=666686 RepID=UPI000247EFE8|nr:hydantoinase/oxoprolinase family protein [Bacillus sp. 1NLA3E]AGK53604.1 5-oxoprolinase [Bacillus sp. 1NLA3E]